MSLITIKNDLLEVCIDTYGAQVKSITGRREYMWEGDPEIWGDTSPNLFPICGKLKDGKYKYKGKEYKMGGHGFARTSEFSVREKTESSVSLYIKDSESTRESYPFNFDFEIKFTLNENSLKIENTVSNSGSEELWFITGSHEGYATPEGIDDYELVFPNEVELNNYVLEGVFLTGETELYQSGKKVFPLKDKYFVIDSLCFKDMGANSVILRHKGGDREIEIDFPVCNYFVIWHVPGAPFICLEPWTGFPDYIDTDGDITKKEGVQMVDAGERKTITHTITFR